ncbi:MAG: L,D-transpeptidase [Phycisphaerae bacterium]
MAERGHCTRALLARLNPGKSLDGLAVGDVLTLPNVATEPPLARAARLVVNLAVKQVQPVARDGRALGLFHCSIAKHKEKRPSGRCTVKVVSPDPVYVFDPKMWPEVKGVDRKLVIPPGPRNPVGQFWIGLSLPGYGIHGTPEPELIGKTGSHGCFRLANWDAVRLGRMVRPGIPVEFVNSAAAPDETALRGGPALAAAPAARRGPDATVSRPVRLMALRRASRDPSR